MTVPMCTCSFCVPSPRHTRQLLLIDGASSSSSSSSSAAAALASTSPSPTGAGRGEGAATEAAGDEHHRSSTPSPPRYYVIYMIRYILDRWICMMDKKHTHTYIYIIVNGMESRPKPRGPAFSQLMRVVIGCPLCMVSRTSSSCCCCCCCCSSCSCCCYAPPVSSH
jgi:hypothetical protein